MKRVRSQHNQTRTATKSQPRRRARNAQSASKRAMSARRKASRGTDRVASADEVTAPCLLIAAALALSACTGQIPGSFRFQQQEESFRSEQEVNTTIDLLWVVDNSASMDVSQKKLRSGFESFARRYLKPTWDIRLAVITTDTFMAHPAFAEYRNTVIPGSVGWTSPYIQGRLATFENPSWNTNLVNLSTGAFDSGIKFGELVPAWMSDFGRLLPGLHDGPVTAFCFEAMPYFMNGVTQCRVRDDQTAATGPGNCVNPPVGQDSAVHCVNTVQNDTVRSGRPIIETMPPEGTDASEAWVQALIRDFMINVSTGSAGQGSERGLGSLQQLLADNETSDSRFFRTKSLRGIIFVSDEEDQTLRLPETPPAGFDPQTGFACDQAGLIAMNGTTAITGNNGYCCTDPAKNCLYGDAGTSCASKTVDGYTYTPSVCADPAQLVPVTEIKDELDQFFLTLDGNTRDTGADPNYFVVSIVPLTAASIQALQAARDASDAAVGAVKTIAVDRGDRYLELGTLVGNGSMSMDIGASDYSPILDAIGKTIIAKKGTFLLNREPTEKEEMFIKIVHEDGTYDILQDSQYVIDGNTIRITDLDFVLTLQSTDRIVINYQPTTSYSTN